MSYHSSSSDDQDLEELIAIQRREENLLKLINETRCEIIQENGQRKLGGPPPNWEGPPPPKGCEIFVGKIPRDVYEDELFRVFSRIGPVYELRLMMDFSGSNRGFAFIQYANRNDAARAIRELNDHELRPKHKIGVVKSIDNCRLFVGGIPKNKSQEEIKVEMERLTEGVSKVIVYSSITDKSKNRGFAFVEYVNHRAASKARRKLIPDRIQLWGKEIAVDWAEPECEIEDYIMSKVTVLYVRNLSLTTTESLLKDVFNRASGGDVQKLKMMRDFAFIHFTSRANAEKAMKLLNNTEINGTKVEITWAKPAKEKKQVTSNKQRTPSRKSSVVSLPPLSPHREHFPNSPPSHGNSPPNMFFNDFFPSPTYDVKPNVPVATPQPLNSFQRMNDCQLRHRNFSVPPPPLPANTSLFPAQNPFGFNNSRLVVAAPPTSPFLADFNGNRNCTVLNEINNVNRNNIQQPPVFIPNYGFAIQAGAPWMLQDGQRKFETLPFSENANPDVLKTNCNAFNRNINGNLNSNPLLLLPPYAPRSFH